jgi:hypothetical protein
MSSILLERDAIIIGGGFYGAIIAIYLKKELGFNFVTLIEQEGELMSRASYNNQARIHNGYHYPRSYTTAYRSRVNFPKFLKDWPQAVYKNFISLYAIARKNSKVTAKQFVRFCNEIGLYVEQAPNNLKALFSPYLIENVFLTEEYSFNASSITDWVRTQLHNCGVSVQLNTKVLAINNGYALNPSKLNVAIQRPSGSIATLTGAMIFNCSYSGLNQISGDFGIIKTQLKQEITEIALLSVTREFANIGITVMDGPFFSLMPFPSRNLHSLSHVRYTPHLNWVDQSGIDPYEKLKHYHCDSRSNRIIRDVGRYVPGIFDAKYIESLFEVKTVLVKNEVDDGRPILFEKHPILPNCYSILGGKIDNIYDVLKLIDEIVI